MWQDPWWLLLLLTVPLLIWRMIANRRRDAIAFSSAVSDVELPSTLRTRLLWLPPACTVAALVLMILALARPREGRVRTVIDSEGIAIEMVVDRSSSMQAHDFHIDGSPVDRLSAVKNVASRFIVGDQSESGSEARLAGRFSDLVGLIVFAGYADVITPPTLDHRFLDRQLDQTQIVNRRSEDGTAIGDAISLAVEKLESLGRGRRDEINSKVIILLTDGENTAGEIEPMRAAEMAAAMGVKVYTIGVGTRGVAPVPAVNPITGQTVLRNMRVSIDEDMLMEIANATGGQYFRATDTASLESIYAEIDQLEKTKSESQDFVDYRELAVQPIRWGGTSLPPLLLVALLLITLRVVLVQTVLKQFP